jgi:hypothetical protein
MSTEYDMVDALISNENWKIGHTRVCNSASPSVQMPSTELYKNPGVDETSLPAATDGMWERVRKAERTIRRVSKGTPNSVEAAMEEYYDIKLGIAGETMQEDKNKLVLSYLEGLQWVLSYYYKGPPSWDWYYPYHYSPFAVDVVDVLESLYNKGNSLTVTFDQGKPFLPFQQLMAVLPPASGRNLLPQSLYQLMVSPRSPIVEFYPEEFQIDIDGVKVPWGGVTIIPFVDEKKLVSTIDSVIAQGSLAEAEKHRNSQGSAKIFFRAPSEGLADGAKLVKSVVSTIPTLVKDVSSCKLSVQPFEHLPLPEGVAIFPHHVMEGYSPLVHKDFPSLFKYIDKFFVNFSFGSGVRIFNSTSKQESLFIHLTVKQSRIAELERVSNWKGSEKIAVNFPFYSKELSLVSVSDVNVKIRFQRGKPSTEINEPARHEGDIDWLLSRLEESGLLVEVEQSGEGLSELYKQPVMELSSDLRRPETVKALASLCIIVESKPKTSTLVTVKSMESPQTIQEEQISLNIHNHMIFGHSFTIAVDETALFKDLATAASVNALNSGIDEILKISKSVKYSQWLTAHAIALTLAVSEDFVWSIFGEVWIRFGRFQEEVGMNLWSLASTGEPQCVPGFSMFTPSQSRRTDKRGNFYWNRWDQPDRSEWKFSSEAVAALRQYMREQPELIKEIQETVFGNSRSAINGGITVQGKRLFSRYKRPAEAKSANSRDDWVSEYHLNKIVGYVNSARWKNISICPWNYEALGGSFVGLIADFTDQFRPHLVKQDISISASQTFPLSETTLASSLKNGGEPTLGRRGIYVKKEGLVPIGTSGTVIGFYGSDLVDILLDDESMNASSLNGVCPEMRGIRIKRADWRVSNVTQTNANVDAQLSASKNKILAQLVIEHEKVWNARLGAKPVVSGAIQPVHRGEIQPVVPPGGIKLNVNDLFASAGQAQPPRQLTAPRRPLPPTALVQLPSELGIAIPQPVPAAPKAPGIPDFLLGKIRPPK